MGTDIPQLPMNVMTAAGEVHDPILGTLTVTL
jgi:hypothetical protein